ncbi:MAG: FadR/GntR family transcriptional regulator [Dehalococcoidia bacterium]
MNDGPSQSTHEEFAVLDRDATLTERVTNAVLKKIVDGNFRSGDRLPSERNLAEQFGVSRTVIREAVSYLVAKGAIEVRAGSGLRVASLDATIVAESLRLYLAGAGGLDYSKIHEVREAVEPHIAALASLRATDDDLERLTSVHKRMLEVADDAENASRQDVEFHRAIAIAAHNPLFLIMLESIEDVLLQVRLATIEQPGRPARAHAHHDRIYKQIVARSPDAAWQAMHEHLADSAAMWAQVSEAGHHDPLDRTAEARNTMDHPTTGPQHDPS